MNNKELPCAKCIVFAMCKNKKPRIFLSCIILFEYIYGKEVPKLIAIDRYERAIDYLTKENRDMGGIPPVLKGKLIEGTTK